MTAVAPTCAGCGSADLLLTDGNGTAYGLCRACERLQEVETRPEPIRQLCDNCAYRPDSPERADPWGWAEHRARHVEGGQPFYCHKGLPLDFDPAGQTRVIEGEATTAEAARKPCAGWFAARLAHCHRQVQAPARHPVTNIGE